VEQKTTEWCFAWAGPCLPSSEWAAWTQAGISVVALLIALWAVIAPIREAHLSRVAAAKLAASGILVHLNQNIGCLQTVARGLHRRINGLDEQATSPGTFLLMLDTLSLPAHAELMALSGSLPDCAVELVRAKNCTLQVRHACDLLVNRIGWRDEAHMVELLTPLLAQATLAANAFASVQRRLDQFAPN